MSDYEIDTDTACQQCGHSPIHWRRCERIGCDDGYYDEYEDDAINYSPGEVLTKCETCHGTGIERWCPQCGADLSLAGAGVVGA